MIDNSNSIKAFRLVVELKIRLKITIKRLGIEKSSWGSETRRSSPLFWGPRRSFCFGGVLSLVFFNTIWLVLCIRLSPDIIRLVLDIIRFLDMIMRFLDMIMRFLDLVRSIS